MERQLTQTSEQDNSPSPGKQRSNENEDKEFSYYIRREQPVQQDNGLVADNPREQLSNEREFCNDINVKRPIQMQDNSLGADNPKELPSNEREPCNDINGKYLEQKPKQDNSLNAHQKTERVNKSITLK